MKEPQARSTSRLVSGIERYWLAADRIHPPFVNQMVLEGDALPEPPGGDWPAVMAEAARALPGMRVRLRGFLGWSRWMADGPVPRIRRVEASSWSGRDPEGAPFLADRLSPRRGPVAEVVLCEGDPARVVIRTLHAATDGQGTLLFARTLFATLRGENPPVATMGPLTDLDLASRLEVPGEKTPKQDCVAPTGAAAPKAPFATTWYRTRAPGRYRQLLARVAVGLARVTDRPVGGVIRVDIPTDLRRLVPDLRSSANLTGMLRIPVHPHLSRSRPVQAMANAIKTARESWRDLPVVRAASYARWVPLILLRRGGTVAARRCLRKQRYPSSAVLSNLGRLPLDDFSGGGFFANRAFFIPPGNPGLPLFLTLTGDAEGVELCASLPEGLATDRRIRTFLDRLVAELGEPGSE